MGELIHPNPVAKITVILLMGLVIFTVLLQFRDSGFFMDAAVALFALVVVLALASYLASFFTSIEVTEDEVAFKKGILSITRVHVPYSRVTSINMRQSLIERLFGLGTLEIETAGGPKTEIAINAMPFATLKKIVGEIREEADKRRPTGGPDR